MTDDTPTAKEDSRLPELNKDAFDCPRCGTFANQTWKTLARRVHSQTVDFDDSAKAYGRWSAASCTRCREWSVWREERMMYPTSATVPVPHPDMPPEAKSLYEEAREVLAVSRRAGTALARASLERLLRTIDPDAGRVDLATRIERILPDVPSWLGEMLTVIRYAGNKSLHVDDEPSEVLVLVLDPHETEIVELMFSAINDLVEEKISKPQKSTAMYAKVPEAIRDRVEKAKANGQGG